MKKKNFIVEVVKSAHLFYEIKAEDDEQACELALAKAENGEEPDTLDDDEFEVIDVSEEE